MENLSSFIVPGSAAAIIIALSIFIVRGVKTNNDVNAETVAALRVENKTIREERDYERKEKHDWATYATKLIYYIEDEHRQISNYLQDNKLDPTRFTFREMPVKRSIGRPGER